MLNRVPYLLWSIFLIVFSRHLPAEPNQETLLFCGDQAGWPPYTFEQHGQIKGYDIDLLQRILKPAGIRYRVTMLPWRRCLKMVKQGDIHVALSASGDHERERIYRMSRTYYLTTPSYIYLKQRFPDGLDLSPKKLLQKGYKICGLRGCSYRNFGFLPDQIEATTDTFRQLFHKTKAGRCDLLLARYEVIEGFAQTGQFFMGAQWAHEPVPGSGPDHFKMLVSRNIPGSEQLHERLNQGIAALEAEGILEQLLRQYLKTDAPSKQINDQ